MVLQRVDFLLKLVYYKVMTDGFSPENNLTSRKNSPERKLLNIERVFSVKVGVHKTPEAVNSALEGMGVKVVDKARMMLEQIPLSQETQEILIADISVEELGLPDQSRYDTIRARAIGSTVSWQGGEYVIESCLGEDGPALREAHKDQPKDDWIRVGMEGIELPIGNSAIFRIVHGKDDVLYLDTDDGGDDDDTFDDHVHFAWRLRKK